MLFTPLLGNDNNQLLQLLDRNLNPESYESYRKLINIEPNGREKEFVLFTVKKGRDKIAALFTGTVLASSCSTSQSLSSGVPPDVARSADVPSLFDVTLGPDFELNPDCPECP